jgi:hypothetical protein
MCGSTGASTGEVKTLRTCDPVQLSEQGLQALGSRAEVAPPGGRVSVSNWTDSVIGVY